MREKISTKKNSKSQQLDCPKNLKQKKNKNPNIQFTDHLSQTIQSSCPHHYPTRVKIQDIKKNKHICTNSHTVYMEHFDIIIIRAVIIFCLGEILNFFIYSQFSHHFCATCFTVSQSESHLSQQQWGRGGLFFSTLVIYAKVTWFAHILYH